jgi:hypothetical protein
MIDGIFPHACKPGPSEDQPGSQVGCVNRFSGCKE